MAQIEQIQFRYVPQEDRLLLRIKTRDRSELRFWMTRRYLKLLWPVLVKLLESNAQVQQQSDPQSRRTVLSFQHEQALARSDLSTDYREDAAQTPLGEAPVLLAKIQVKRDASASPVLCLHPLQGQGVELAMNEVMLHSFCKLISDQLPSTDWDLSPSGTPASDHTSVEPHSVN
jgi:hypothetical protein